MATHPGVWDGGRVVTGWPATDWLETIVLRSEGPEFYDRWAAHEIPFDHPAAVAALEKVGCSPIRPGTCFLTPVLSTTGGSRKRSSLRPRMTRSVCCSLRPGGSPAYFIDDAPMVAMPFPTIEPAFASSMEGGGDFAIAVSDRPEVRAVMRGLASPAWGVPWAQSGVPFYAAHRGFDLDVYPDAIAQDDR